uniref:Junctional adhesion molecule 2 n=1 Tax=Buteo japonicus TaxID=224669 RepID=A0A8C0BFB9_9AVES
MKLNIIKLKTKKNGTALSFTKEQKPLCLFPLKGDLRGRAEMLNTGIRIRNVTRKDSGTYRCEISAKSEEGQRLGEATITLTVLVAPTTPVCEVPSSAMTGTVVELSCKETEGSPPSEYQWYKNGVALLEKTGTGSARAANITYTMNKKSGTLLFNTVTKNDTGEYFCEASNGIGLSQKCSVKRMQVDDLNVSGIIAAVVFVALVMALCGLGVFYAQKKGYFTSNLGKAASRTLAPGASLLSF